MNKCDKCGTEYRHVHDRETCLSAQLASMTKQANGECLGVIPGTFVACGEGGNYCSVACHLRGQLASMTKRAEEAEKSVEYWIKDSAAGWDKCEVRRLEAVAAEAKLATAVEALQRVTRSDYSHAQRAIAEDALRALGVKCRSEA